MDQRSTTFEKSLHMGKEFQRRAKAMILRAAVLRNQIHVKVEGKIVFIIFHQDCFGEADFSCVNQSANIKRFYFWSEMSVYLTLYIGSYIDG